MNTSAQAQTLPTRRRETKWIAVILGVLLLLALARYLHADAWLRRALAWISDLGAVGMVLFVVLYALAAILLIPGSVLTLGAGAVFGVVKGSICVSVAATLGACGAFLIGRYLARDTAQRRISGHPRFAAIDRAVAKQGWKIVLLTRLSPVFPFTLLNYAFGLTSVSFRDYALASWVGMMPGTVMYVYLGSIAQAATGPVRRTPAEWALYAAGLLATVAVTVFVTRLARKELSQQLETPGNK